MRKQNFVALMVLCVSLVGMGMVSCKNDLFIAPTFGNSTGSNEQQFDGENGAAAGRFGAPTNLTATQGMYQEITLNWNPVKDAVRYYIYRANTQFESFVQVGETGDNSTNYTMKVSSGANYYYRVTAVTSAGKESSFSPIVRGTSLAQPLVSAIEGVEGKGDSDVIVYWYMGNVDAYQDLVRYNVICRDEKDTEITRVIVNGNETKETAALIQGLNSNTNYKYEVEAYLISDQNRVEKCDPIGATTARLLRPKAPDELVVEKGQSKDTVTLSFKLPSLVYVALPGGLYEEKPLYFKIYRREYVEQSTGVEKNWELLKADLGKTETVPSENELQKVDFGKGDQEYTPGDIVTWVDTTPLKRGVKYEYKVQSYAYTEREITSNFSASTDLGWLISTATFGTADYNTKKDNDENPSANVAATLKFSFKFETMGLDDEYHFILAETRYSLEGDEEDGESKEKGTNFEKFTSVKAINEYVRSFEGLDTNKDVRGYYEYKLSIMSHDNVAILELDSLTRAIVTQDINLPVIQYFSATAGYSNKIELEWKHNPDYSYSISYSSNGGDAQIIEHDTLYADQNIADNEMPILKYNHIVEPGVKYEYKLTVKNDNIAIDSLPIEGSTSKQPQLTAAVPSYDSITVSWEDVPASSFQVSAKYDDATIANQYKIESQTLEGNINAMLAENTRTVTFEKPAGYNNATISGKPLTVTVEADVPVTRTVHELFGSSGSSYNIYTNPVETIKMSSNVPAVTMGPALVNATASVGTYSDKITLSWNKIENAQAYVILRNSHHISSESRGNNIVKEFQNTQTYIVTNVDSTPSVALNPEPTDTAIVKKYLSVEKTDTGFTLTDTLCVTESDDPTVAGWIRSQSQLSWGAPYEYIVLPVLSSGDTINYDYENTGSAVANIEPDGGEPITLTSVPSSHGATKGYAWNVKATKGTYSENGENTGVKLTWTRPWAMPTESYSIYRAELTDDDLIWEKLGLGSESNKVEFIDKNATPGKMYRYMVAPAVTDSSFEPHKNKEYVAFNSDIMDKGEQLASGFMLPQVQFSVTKDKVIGYTAELGGKEELTWQAASIKGKANYLFHGYIVEVLNKDIDNEWHEIACYTFNDNIQNTGSYTERVDNKDGLLKVKNSYRHYFRIRTYTFDETEGNRVLSKAPVYTWSDDDENDFVEWGARALTPEEFLWCAGEVMRVGINAALDNGVYGGWQTQYDGWGIWGVSDFGPIATTNTAGGVIHSESSGGVGMWVFLFDSWKGNFMSVKGRLGAESAGTGQLPRFFFTNMTGTTGPKDETDKTGYNFYKNTYGTTVSGEGMTITGPSDVNGMYDGVIEFIDVGTTSGGHIIVKVNGETKTLYGGFKKYTTLPGA